MNLLKFLSFIKKLYNRFKRDEVTSAGAELTYYLILSFFPFLIFVITLVSYTPVTQEDVLANLSRLLPYETYAMVINIINEILQSRSTSLISIGMIATIWTSSRGVKSIIRGLNKAYNRKENRPFWKNQVIGIILTITLAFGILFTFIAIVFGKVIGEYLFGLLGISAFFALTWSVLRYVIPLTGLTIIFMIIYKYAPICKLSFKKVLPGAIFSTFGWILISTAFSYYVNNFSSFSRTYGSIGGIIVLLVWLYLSSIIILIGGEINAIIYSSSNKEPTLNV